ncbi:hypothetical protein B0T18DRAFT_436452 [Schizothecium vesticola]|uniref:Zn(2)-C6 fungal-type domain-containing protein n=1 Tax=Schizothecium vesticola TaxID=314040 RepID=A0AA40F712_9PEZI|nr:hypothetical protein B0T18DRAFT_436452 [Schizothecium vesticola]
MPPVAGTPLTPAATSTGTPPSDAADAAKPRRARTSKPKVKTGCNNCKQRRIKCDEKRPSCANCVRSKKICSGYPPPPRSARPFEEIRIAPKPILVASAPPPGREAIQLPPRRVQKFQRRNLTPPQTPSPPRTVATLCKPIITLPFTLQEGLYFQLFQEQTANELSGFFDSGFWSRTVLQECHSEASIRHAVVALGALYKTLEKSTESPQGSPTGERDPTDTAWRHWEMAVKQYSNACQELMTAGSADTPHRTRLMASVLLACFDSFIGDHKQAIVQIQTGLGLLEQLRAERRRAFMPRPEEPVEAELIQMFTRLAIQAKSYDMAFHFPQPYVVRLTPSQPQDPSSPTESAGSPVSIYQDPIPDRFSSVLEARFKWDALAERTFRFTETMFNQTRSSVMGILPQHIGQYGARFKQEMEAWSDAFEHILASRTAPGVSSQEKACIAVLKMYQVMSYILLLMTFSKTEMGFDKYTSDFSMIVDLALEVVGDEERRAAQRRCPDPQFCRHRGRHEASFGGLSYAARHIKPSFSADLGIVPPLFVVATKCRDRALRWKAIQLLKSSPRREGMWDSELTARIAMWVADIEDTSDPAESAHSEPDIFHMVNASMMRTPPAAAGDSPRPSTSGSGGGGIRGSIDFGDISLGPGGNARYDPATRRQSNSNGSFAGRSPSALPPIPEDKRVMVRAVEFDLRERFAVVQLGSRELPTGSLDLKTRVTKITW